MLKDKDTIYVFIGADGNFLVFEMKENLNLIE